MLFMKTNNNHHHQCLFVTCATVIFISIECILVKDPDCPWCPLQPDTPEHLLMHCPRHHSHRMALLHSLVSSPQKTNSNWPLRWLSRPWPGLQSTQTHQDLPPKDRSIQRNLIHSLICNLHFWHTRGCGTTPCTAKANFQEVSSLSYLYSNSGNIIEKKANVIKEKVIYNILVFRFVLYMSQVINCYLFIYYYYLEAMGLM